METNDPIQTKIDRDKELAQAQLKGQKQIIETLGKNEEERLRRSVASKDQIEAACADTQAKTDDIDKRLAQNSGSGVLTGEQTLRKVCGARSCRKGADCRYGCPGSPGSNSIISKLKCKIFEISLVLENNVKIIRFIFLTRRSSRRHRKNWKMPAKANREHSADDATAVADAKDRFSTHKLT